MPNFSNLNLSRALAEENEEDELDRLIAGHAAAVQAPKDAPKEPDADAFTGALQELLEDDEEEEYADLGPALTEDEDRARRGGMDAVHIELEEDEPVAKASGLVRKGDKNPHGATNKERVTAVDAAFLGHLGVFRCADVFTLSRLQFGRFNPRTRKDSGRLMSPVTVGDRLKKLKRLGMVDSFTNRVTGQKLWSATDRGIAAARSFGYMERDSAVTWGGAEGMGYSTISHYAAISLFAALLVSPMNPYKELFGEVHPNDLVSEAEIRRAQKPIANQLWAENKGKKEKKSFGDWRVARIDEVMDDIRKGKLALEDLLDFYPELWTLGQPEGTLPVKQTHWPDLVVSRESGRTTASSKSFAVEIELTLKSTAELIPILRTVAMELKTPLIYGHFVYVGPVKVEKKLRKLDEDLGLGLFDSGRFHFIPLTDGEGNAITANTRVGG